MQTYETQLKAIEGDDDDAGGGDDQVTSSMALGITRSNTVIHHIYHTMFFCNNSSMGGVL